MKKVCYLVAALSLLSTACEDESGIGSAVHSCTVDECDGDTLNRCVDGRIESETCENGCADAACIEKNDNDPGIKDPECTKDVCLDAVTLNRCVDGQYQPETCENGCADDACIGSSGEGDKESCVEDKCADEKTINRCVDGAFKPEACEYGCVDGNCLDKPEEGTPEHQCDESKCADDKTLNVCEDGVLNTMVCEFGCADNACSPDPAGSDDGNDDGGEEGGTEPPEDIIIEPTDKCTKNTCEDGDTLLVCTNGEISNVFCNFGCKDGACLPDSSECTADIKKTCKHGCSNNKCWPDPVVSLNGKRVLFTGNSLSYYGRMVISASRPVWQKDSSGAVKYRADGMPLDDVGIFELIAKQYGDKVTVTNFTYGSSGFRYESRKKDNASKDCYQSKTTSKVCMSSCSSSICTNSTQYGQFELMRTLHPHYYNYDKNGAKNMDPFYKQDYVVFQQKSTPATPSDTYKQAKQLAALFPPETQFVMMMTHYGYDEYPVGYEKDGKKNNKKYYGGYESSIEKTRINDGWIVVPWGKVVKKIWNGKYSELTGYSIPDFIINDKKHPNTLTGYITALTAYGAMTNRSVQNDQFFKAETGINTVKDRYYVRRETWAVDKGYYNNTDETKFGNMLKNDDTMLKINKRIDKELAEYDNIIMGMNNIVYFGNMTGTNPGHLTDNEREYDKSSSSTYSSFSWTTDNAVAKNWEKAPHFAAGSKTASATGKYLGGFYYELPRAETIYKFRLHNPNTTLEIDGFDILTSMDGKTWNVAWSGSKLSCQATYKVSPNYNNVNYIYESFTPVKAKYVMFALTQPRCQHADAKQIKAYNDKYHKGEQVVSSINSAPENFRMTELSFYRYTAR